MSKIHYLKTTKPPKVWCGKANYQSGSSEWEFVDCQKCLGMSASAYWEEYFVDQREKRMTRND